MSMKKQFAAIAVALPLLASLVACSDHETGTGRILTTDLPTRVKSVERVGRDFGGAFYKVVLDGPTFGRTKDITCVRYDWREGSMSCDWDAGGPHIAP